jgi:hypothetical protein
MSDTPKPVYAQISGAREERLVVDLGFRVRHGMVENLHRTEKGWEIVSVRPASLQEKALWSEVLK